MEEPLEASAAAAAAAPAGVPGVDAVIVVVAAAPAAPPVGGVTDGPLAGEVILVVVVVEEALGEVAEAVVVAGATTAPLLTVTAPFVDVDGWPLGNDDDEEEGVFDPESN